MHVCTSSMSVSNKHTICAYPLLYWPHGSSLIDQDYRLFLQRTIAFSSQLKQQFMWLAQSGGRRIYSVYSLKLQVLKCIIFLCSQRAERGEAGGVSEGVRRRRPEEGVQQMVRMLPPPVGLRFPSVRGRFLSYLCPRVCDWLPVLSVFM